MRGPLEHKVVCKVHVYYGIAWLAIHPKTITKFLSYILLKMRMMLQIFTIIGVLLFLNMAKAYSPYREKIPNGDKVMSACDPGRWTCKSD